MNELALFACVGGTRIMNYLSVCSGIEAATVAWHHMGWKPVGFSEIEKFPSQVLAHHYSQVTNFGDMTKYKEWNLESIDILVGGTPCQSFSVAGLRKGLEDPRGNLMLTYCGLLDKFRPKWFIWENVPGVLSSNGGRDFGSFLGAVAELGYGFAYRVLDAQYFGVAQRRRRVFVVGCLGDWKSAAKVLFEPESLCRNTPPRRKSREEIASTITARFGASRNNHEECVVFKSDIANCLQTTSHEWSRADGFNMIAYENHPSDSRVKEMGDVCSTVTSSWGTGGGNTPYVQKVYPIHPQAESFQGGGRKNNDGKGNALGVGKENDPMFTLTTVDRNMVSYSLQGSMIGRDDKNGPQGDGINEEVCFTQNATDRHGVIHAFKVRGGCEGGGKGYLGQDEKAFTISTTQDQHLYANMAVRRLTPKECERLPGFPDDYTDIKPKGKDTPDGPRYKALGNSMAVPVMRWIGERINLINKAQEK